MAKTELRLSIDTLTLIGKFNDGSIHQIIIDDNDRFYFIDILCKKYNGVKYDEKQIENIDLIV